MASDRRDLIVVADAAELATTAANRIIARINASQGRIAICLAGGSTPNELYHLLATEPWRSRIPWDRVHWFVGDERFVPAGDPLNNMTTARRIFLDQCAPTRNVHPVATDVATPDDAARAYEADLKSFHGSDRLDPRTPLFDLVLLGTGVDGHIASLFPGDPALDERDRWVVGVARAKAEPLVPRVTLTLPALAASREILFEASGPGKRAILTRLFRGENLPANRAHAHGETVWLVDKAALPETALGQ